MKFDKHLSKRCMYVDPVFSKRCKNITLVQLFIGDRPVYLCEEHRALLKEPVDMTLQLDAVKQQ